MNNAEFLKAIEESFKAFIEAGSSRSTAKLVPLHSAIARDMQERFGNDYSIQSLGIDQGKEGKIKGRYMEKHVDISISRNDTPVCGIEVKFVMQNYSQNSGNYFNNMLGETANIRCLHCPYFQLLILPAKMPYYKNGGDISRWEHLSEKHIQKYRILDTDDPTARDYSPDKMLIYIIQIPDAENETSVDKKKKYFEFCQHCINERPVGFINVADDVFTLEQSNEHLVILNDYEQFADKIYHKVRSREHNTPSTNTNCSQS